jgi:hypothetical protein
VKPGDLVRVAALPKYWGAADLRGSVGLVISQQTVTTAWWNILIDGVIWPLTYSCLEVIDEAG